MGDQEGTTISSVSESTLVDSKAHAKAGMDPSKWMGLGVVLSTRQMAQRAEHGVVHVFLCSLASLMPLPLLWLLLLLLSLNVTRISPFPREGRSLHEVWSCIT